MLRSSQCVPVRDNTGRVAAIESERREGGKDMRQDGLKLGAQFRKSFQCELVELLEFAIVSV